MQQKGGFGGKERLQRPSWDAAEAPAEATNPSLDPLPDPRHARSTFDALPASLSPPFFITLLGEVETSATRKVSAPLTPLL